jgi:hypothetical protein
MKSIKPGRGPSMMGGIAGIFACLFGVFWTIMAVQMGAPFFFPIFGVFFVIMGIANTIYNFKNATGKNRHSVYDIVDSREEPDPWETRHDSPDADLSGTNFCPYCGAPVETGFEFCAKCGKKLPD